MRRRLQLLFSALLAVVPAVPLRAETFVLASGGRFEGELVNPAESPRKTYLVRMPAGGQVSLTKNQVEKVLSKSDARRRYEATLLRMPQTADGNWKMAGWCLENDLKAEREFHLLEVVRLEPNHEGARHAQGFSRIDGRWVKQDDLMRERGFVRFKGSWRLPQDVALERAADEFELREKAWAKKLRLWRQWLVKARGREGEARANFLELTDPMAAPAIADFLSQEGDPPSLKMMYIDVLVRLKNPMAITALIARSLEDEHDSVRDKCLDVLAKWGTQQAIAYFLAGLKHKDNEMVNRAAVGLARMNDPSVTPALIHALVTKHQFVVSTGSGNMNVGFSPTGGAGGMSVGGGPKKIDREFQNDAVLAALTKLNPGVNHAYDQDAWKRWDIDRRTPKSVSLRRDGT